MPVEPEGSLLLFGGGANEGISPTSPSGGSERTVLPLSAPEEGGNVVKVVDGLRVAEIGLSVC